MNSRLKYRFFLAVCTGCILSFPFSNRVYASPQGGKKETQETAIESLRKGSIHIKGSPGEVVKVEQLKHEFWFGCAISSNVFNGNTRMSESDKSMFKEKFLENFNSAVTENAVKWGSMERSRGVIDYQTADNILDWTEANDLPCRGHNLYWGIDQFVQGWVKDLDEKELRKAVKKRGIETAEHYLKKVFPLQASGYRGISMVRHFREEA